MTAPLLALARQVRQEGLALLQACPIPGHPEAVTMAHYLEILDLLIEKAEKDEDGPPEAE